MGECISVDYCCSKALKVLLSDGVWFLKRCPELLLYPLSFLWSLLSSTPNTLPAPFVVSQVREGVTESLRSRQDSSGAALCILSSVDLPELPAGSSESNATSPAFQRLTVTYLFYFALGYYRKTK